MPSSTFFFVVQLFSALASRAHALAHLRARARMSQEFNERENTVLMEAAYQGRDDVVKVAINRPDDTTLEQVAADFGIHPMTLSKWIRQRRIDTGERCGVTSTESAENRELKRRVRLLEQENEVLRRAAAYLGKANLPKG